MARWTINDWNTQIDRTLTVRRLGKQGILYEYELPYGADPLKYYEEAINVKSIKRSERYENGRRPGQYQPVGDKRYFNYYQVKKMTSKQKEEWLLELYMKSMLEDFIENLENKGY